MKNLTEQINGQVRDKAYNQMRELPYTPDYNRFYNQIFVQIRNQVYDQLNQVEMLITNQVKEQVYYQF